MPDDYIARYKRIEKKKCHLYAIFSNLEDECVGLWDDTHFAIDKKKIFFFGLINDQNLG